MRQVHWNVSYKVYIFYREYVYIWNTEYFTKTKIFLQIRGLGNANIIVIEPSI